MTLTLYQFPISHYCEEARWALDWKGLEYRRVNLLPGLHLARSRKMAARTSVPILVSADTIVQGRVGKNNDKLEWVRRLYREYR